MKATSGDNQIDPRDRSELSEEDLAAIGDLLRRRRHFELGSYKDSCIKRRIAKRMRALGLSAPGAYRDVLQRREDEVDLLLATLTIHVSQFFRNPDTFSVLKEKVLPELVRSAERDGRELRLWSAGCAGGEEPYSLALLLQLMRPSLPVTILGTDISETVLQQARHALFDPMRLKEVSPELRERFFRREGTSFRLNPEIRRQVTFRRHDVLTAVEYPRADLILCRNMLIYFDREDQNRILGRFAETLRPGGRLVLGRAEALSAATRHLFGSEYPVERIYVLHGQSLDPRRSSEGVKCAISQA